MKNEIKFLIRAALLGIFPTWMVRVLVNLLGYHIEKGARIGFSLILVDSLRLDNTSRIGHFNRLKGPFEVEIGYLSSLGNFNTVLRAGQGVSVGRSLLKLCVRSKITSRHFVDMTCSITIGSYSTVAGNGCQLWTHGYVHAMDGIDRYRIDGPIVIEDNVYIGSMSFISMGVRIAKGVIVGGGTSVARDLLEPGLYVSSPLRQLPRPPEPETRADLEAVDPALSEDRVFRKRDR